MKRLMERLLREIKFDLNEIEQNFWMVEIKAQKLSKKLGTLSNFEFFWAQFFPLPTTVFSGLKLEVSWPWI